MTFLSMTIGLVWLLGCGQQSAAPVYTRCKAVRSAVAFPPVEWNHPLGQWVHPSETESPNVAASIEIMKKEEFVFCARWTDEAEMACMRYKPVGSTQMTADHLEQDCL